MITQERLKEVLSYDPDTGIFVYKSGKGGVVKGNVVSGLDGCGYIKIGIDYKQYRAHRLAWLYVYGKWPSGELDHINHDRQDNRIENLRDVERTDNGRNLSIKSNNTSGVTGVQWNRQNQNWRARVMVDGYTINLGSFDNFDDAVAARLAANDKYGFHDNHGK